MKRKAVLAVLLLLIIPLAAGCGSSKKVDFYTDKTLEEAPDGMYVAKKEKKENRYYPFFDMDVNTKNLVRAMYTSQNVWCWATLDEAEKIPDVKEGDGIIIKSETAPDMYISLYRFDQTGSTLGMTVAENKLNGNYLVGTRNIKKGSSAESLLKKAGNEVIISSIGGIPLSSSLLAPESVIKGLNENEKYELEMYEGTKRITGEAVADTRVYTLDPGKIYAFDSLKYTGEGYAVYVPSSDMETGYYYIDGYGFFHYEKPQGEAEQQAGAQQQEATPEQQES